MKYARSRSIILAVMLTGAALVTVSFGGQAERLSREEIATTKGVDASNWGTDISNPFTNLTDQGKEKLKAAGVDVERLPKLKAVLIAGSQTEVRTFVNRNPNTVLVLGRDFLTHGEVYSNGPVLLVEDAHIMGSLIAANLVWFVEESSPRGKIAGSPIILAPSVYDGQMEAKRENVRHGDYGWRRPDDFLQPPPVNSKGKLPPLAVADADNKRTGLRRSIEAAQGVDTADWCERVVNPLTHLTAVGKARLTARGIDPERLSKLKAVLLTGSYYGVDSKTFVNRDPDTILIIGKGFGSHGDILSLGPILAAEDSDTGTLVGADLVWFVEESFPRGKTTGLPLIVAPSVNVGQMKPGNEDVWHGDYGWHRPNDLLKVIAKAPRKQERERVAEGAQEQDWAQGRPPDERAEKLKQELHRLDVAIKPGDEVVALRNCELMVEAKSVGTVRKGGKCTVEQVQDNWLWVRSGDIRGWIDRGAVIGAALMDWYKRLPDNSSVEQPGISRAKYDGILFEIVDAGQRGSIANSFQGATYNGVPLPWSLATTYSNLGIFTRNRGNGRELGLYLTAGQPLSGPFSGLFEAAFAAKSYGMVQQGDYVFVNPKTRLVFVNGERRRLQ
jgi:hypothetical protein